MSFYQKSTEFINQLTEPFGFLKKDILDAETRLNKEEGNEVNQEQSGDHMFAQYEFRMRD